MSKIREALSLVSKGSSPHAAAKKVGIASSRVYAELKRQRAKREGRCPRCGAPVDRNGKHNSKIDATNQ